MIGVSLKLNRMFSHNVDLGGMRDRGTGSSDVQAGSSLAGDGHRGEKFYRPRR